MDIIDFLVKGGFKDEADKLVRDAGGKDVYIPSGISGNNSIKEIIGHDASVYVAERFGDSNVYIRRSNIGVIKAKAISLLIGSNGELTYDDLAKEVGCSVRYLRGIVSEHSLPRPKPKQRGGSSKRHGVGC